MVFSSITFIFAFLPIVLIGYFFCPRALRNLFLLIASLIFYAWGETVYLLIMLASITFNFFLGIRIEAIKANGRKRSVLLFSIGLNLLILIVFKYLNFLVNNLNTLLEAFNISGISIDHIHLPIGISFFTFQAMSYLIDVYRGVTKAQKNFINLGLYIALFPQLIAGPIVRYHDIAAQLKNRIQNLDLFGKGVHRFIIGLAKKVLIANILAQVADNIFDLPATQLSTSLAWLGIICYALQIYYDFSGYSDMAIGLGYMFGFRFLENFNYPYISKSIQEFWRRWHISLSNWFRDYLYIPLGGNRKGNLRTYVNLLIVFILCGFWHGASWNFLIWGLIHGFFLSIERAGLSTLLAKLPTPIQSIYCLMVVLLAWVFFRAADLNQSQYYLQSMFGLNDAYTHHNYFNLYFSFEVFLALIIGVIGSTPLIRDVALKLSLYTQEHPSSAMPLTSLMVFKIALLFSVFSLSILYLASGAYNPFIYYRF